MSVLCLCAVMACLLWTTHGHLPDIAHRYLVGPHEMDPTTDCAMRWLSYNYSVHLLPDRAPLKSVFDALRIAIDCNGTLPPTPPTARPNKHNGNDDYAATYYVATTATCSDSGPGSIGAPFCTVGRGVAAAVAGPQPAQVLLRSGTYFLPVSLEVGATANGLRVAAFPNESPVLSAGVSLPAGDLPWTKYVPPPQPGPNITGPTNGSLLAGCVNTPNQTNPGVCAPLGQFAVVQECVAACLASDACTGYTYHTSAAGPEWATWCYARLDGFDLIEAGDPGHLSGFKMGVLGNVSLWTALVPAGVKPFNQLFVNGRRAMRARWPNANPETQQSPSGFTTAAKWLPPRSFPAPSEVHTANVRPYDPWFPNFQWGTNGSVANFTSGSFWGTRGPPAGVQYRVPSGLTAGDDLKVRLGRWSNPQDAFVHAFHAGQWGDWAFAVGGVDATSGDVTFSSGGTQEARGSASGNGYYVENILEELDAPGEWFFDAVAQRLYMCVNGSAPPQGSLVAAQLETIVALRGSQSQPVVGVTLHGLTFTHTAATFMEPFTAPSGGDWSFHNGGAVVLSGTKGCVVSGCSFISLGGNGLMISGFNRGVTVTGNEFAWMGENAIVSAGLSGNALNGLGGDYPEGTLIESNLAREMGVYVKQTGFYYAAISPNATLVGNVFFNGPRAGININDGFGGGHLIQNNMGFNLVRETADHGVFNSWDREPYFWNPNRPTDSAPLPTVLHQNLFINNYHSVFPIDNDDGSNNYYETQNFLLWGGSKDYLGFNKHMIGNVYVYADYTPILQPFVQRLGLPKGDVSKYRIGLEGGLENGWGVCTMAYGTHSFDSTLIDTWVNNTCIALSSQKFFDFSGCNPTTPLDGNIAAYSSNTYLSGDGGYVMHCNKQTWDLAQAMAVGVDVGSSVGSLPTTEQLIQMGRAKLGF